MEFKPLPRSQRLYQFLTETEHYHLGYFQAPDDSLQDALNRLVLRCLPDLVPRGETLDVGCGMGGAASMLGVHGFPTLGIDPCSRSIDHANTASGGMTGVSFAILKLENLFTSFHYRGPVFDNIMMIEVLQYFRSLEKLFKECHKLNRPAGRVVINDMVTIPSLPWIKVPLHKKEAIPEEARAAGFLVKKYESIAVQVLPTLDCMSASLKKQRSRLISSWAKLHPDIEHDIDALLLQWAIMRDGLLNGDLDYMYAVLHRPDGC
jgi:SAM-dependent methyltransferase